MRRTIYPHVETTLDVKQTIYLASVIQMVGPQLHGRINAPPVPPIQTMLVGLQRPVHVTLDIGTMVASVLH